MKALFSLFFIYAAALASPLPSPGNESSFFHCRMINVAAPEADKSRLIILVGVPVDELSFIKSGQIYQARFGVSIAVIDQDGFGMAEREAQKQIQIKDYAETNSPQKLCFELFEFNLSPGKYKTTVTITDANSGRQASLSQEKVLQDFSVAGGVHALSDIIITNKFETDSTGKPVLAPGFSQDMAAPGEGLHFYLEINSPLDDTPLYVRQIIRDRQGKTAVDQKRPWSRRAVLERLVLPIWTDDLPYGAYELEMQVQHGKFKKEARQEFHVIWNGFPETGMHVQQALAQAALIASSAERKVMAQVAADSSLAAQRAALIDFWSKRDETPATPENEVMAAFYERVAVANARFGGSREGWKTDPGKVFIQLGIPDAIEADNVQPRLQRRQVWRYHRLKRDFLFVDLLGFGDFVLAQEQAR
jgi:GWxTD domain-containing protein